MLHHPISFAGGGESHAHSLETLSLLEKYQDFMMSIDKMADVGCGEGKDLEWWATRTVLDDDDKAIPLDIKCTGIDIVPQLLVARQYQNIVYERRDFEQESITEHSYDVLWSHDSFHYAINPFQTLKNFYNMLTPGGMLCIIVPQTMNLVYHKQLVEHFDGQYFNYNLVNLIYMLAVSGFDCKAGFFKKNIEDPWIHALVYKSDIEPMNPRGIRWYDLAEKGLLPESAEVSINRCGHVRQQDLVLPWLNKSLRDYGA